MKQVGIEIDTFKKQIDVNFIDLDSELVDLNYKVASLIFCHFWRSESPGDIRIVKGIIVYLTKSCLISYGRKHLILRSKPSVCKIKLYSFHALTA